MPGLRKVPGKIQAVENRPRCGRSTPLHFRCPPNPVAIVQKYCVPHRIQACRPTNFTSFVSANRSCTGCRTRKNHLSDFCDAPPRWAVVRLSAAKWVSVRLPSLFSKILHSKSSRGLQPLLGCGVVIVADYPRDFPCAVFVLPQMNEFPFADWFRILVPRVVEAVNTHLHRAITLHMMHL